MPVCGSHSDYEALRETITWLITKYCMTATVVVLVSELAKRSDKPCIILTVVCFGLFAIALRRFGVELL